MNTIIKGKIVDSFSRGAANYHSEAYIQKYFANIFNSHMKSLVGCLPEGPILEIGCGTGYITEGIIDAFSGRMIQVTDISEQMLKICKDYIRTRMRNHGLLDFEVLDGENFREQDKYAMIISGMVFQWFSDFSESVRRLVHGLLPNGLLFCSFLESKSFPQWKTICDEFDLPYTGNTLPDFHSLRRTLDRLPVTYHFWEQTATIIFPTVLHFFKNLKVIGASSKKHPAGNAYKTLRPLLMRFEECYPQEVPMTYTITMGWIKRS